MQGHVASDCRYRLTDLLLFVKLISPNINIKVLEYTTHSKELIVLSINYCLR